MTFLEAALEILRRERKPLHYKDITQKAMDRKLLTFVGRTPEVTMQTQLTAAVKKAPGNPFVRVKPGTFGLLRYPEAMPEAEPPPRASSSAEKTKSAASSAEGRGRRRRRGGRGRGRREEGRLAPVAENGAAVGPGEGPAHEATMAEDDENPAEGPEEPAIDTLSPEARAAALAESGVLEGDDDELEGAEGDDESGEGDDEEEGEVDEQEEERGESSRESSKESSQDSEDSDDSSAPASDDELAAEPFGKRRKAKEGQGPDEGGTNGDLEEEEDEEEDEVGDTEEIAARPAGAAGAAAGAVAFEEGPVGRRRRRRRRRRGGSDSFGDDTAGLGETTLADAAVEGDSGAAAPSAEGGGEAGAAGAGVDSDGGAGRRIMSPIDAAIEILRGQSPGRGMHVRQLADAASRRRLVHGEPSEAWRVMRAALAAEPRERLRAGLRPRVRAAGSGLFALARRPPDLDLERAEHVFGEARRALRERTLAALELRMAELSPAAFEAIARVLLQREGFGPATFVKRVEGTIYLEALRGRGARPSRCLIALRSGNGSAGRRAIGELRAGIRARNQDEGALLLAGRLAEDAIAEWKQPGPPLEVADGAALAETCIRHGVGVINAMVSVDFVDADFFAELQEG
jgi:hypothetical protein